MVPRALRKLRCIERYQFTSDEHGTAVYSDSEMTVLDKATAVTPNNKIAYTECERVRRYLLFTTD